MPDPVRILGIDPGQSGGLAVISNDGSTSPTVVKMPPTERDVYDALWELTAGSPKIRKAYIERVHAMPRQGVVSTGTLMMGYGGLRMALIALEIPFETVAPGVWQRAMGCLSKGNKNVTKARAQELYPGLKITHYISDALLIAGYGLKVSSGSG